MTIIQPNQESKRAQIILITVFLNIVFIASAVGVILLYSQLANFRQEIKKQSAQLLSVGTENAELKNKFYTTVDSINPQQAVSVSSSLVSEPKPEYIKKEQLAGY